jgi:hypothetical protein
MSKDSLTLVPETSNIKNIDMRTKIAIKSENMTSLGEIIHAFCFLERYIIIYK